MHSTNVKIVEAQQADFCNSHRNTKRKLLKTLMRSLMLV